MTTSVLVCKNDVAKKVIKTFGKEINHKFNNKGFSLFVFVRHGIDFEAFFDKNKINEDHFALISINKHSSEMEDLGYLRETPFKLRENYVCGIKVTKKLFATLHTLKKKKQLKHPASFFLSKGYVEDKNEHDGQITFAFRNDLAPTLEARSILEVMTIFDGINEIVEIVRKLNRLDELCAVNFDEGVFHGDGRLDDSGSEWIGPGTFILFDTSDGEQLVNWDGDGY